MECSTILLAGGEGKRFKNLSREYKAFVRFKEVPFFLRVLKQLPNSAANDITIATTKRHAGRFLELIAQYQFRPKPKLVFDEFQFQGPMSGIIKGMQATIHDSCLVVPCDVPLLKTEVLQVLINHFNQTKDASCILPRWPNGYREPLTAIYRKSLLFEPLLRHFEQGERKIQNVLDFLPGVQYVEIEKFRKVDPELHSFFNINTEEEYLKLESLN